MPESSMISNPSPRILAPVREAMCIRMRVSPLTTSKDLTLQRDFSHLPLCPAPFGPQQRPRRHTEISADRRRGAVSFLTGSKGTKSGCRPHQGEPWAHDRGSSRPTKPLGDSDRPVCWPMPRTGYRDRRDNEAGEADHGEEGRSSAGSPSSLHLPSTLFVLFVPLKPAEILGFMLSAGR
jgi:hypothetical protein